VEWRISGARQAFPRARIELCREPVHPPPVSAHRSAAM
jgi:hypothetical protein